MCVYIYICVCVCVSVPMFISIYVSTMHVFFNFGLNYRQNSFPLFEAACSRWFDILALFQIYLDYIGIGVSKCIDRYTYI